VKLFFRNNNEGDLARLLDEVVPSNGQNNHISSPSVAHEKSPAVLVLVATVMTKRDLKAKKTTVGLFRVIFALLF
jgi:hypothetical protein